MIPQHIKERIEVDSESQYVPCGGCGAAKPSERCLGCFHSFAQLAADGYICGAEAEAERAYEIIIDLQEYADLMNDELNEMEKRTRGYIADRQRVLKAVRLKEKIDANLATYNSNDKKGE